MSNIEIWYHAEAIKIKKVYNQHVFFLAMYPDYTALFTTLQSRKIGWHFFIKKYQFLARVYPVWLRNS